MAEFIAIAIARVKPDIFAPCEIDVLVKEFRGSKLLVREPATSPDVLHEIKLTDVTGIYSAGER